MPLSNVYVAVGISDGFFRVKDGERLLCIIDPDRSEDECRRIAHLIASLLANHGANDDTTGLYDEEGEEE